MPAGRAPTDGIRNDAPFYFDASDLTEAAEAEIGTRVQRCFADLDVPIEAKHQARAHAW